MTGAETVDAIVKWLRETEETHRQLSQLCFDNKQPNAAVCEIILARRAADMATAIERGDWRPAQESDHG